MKVLAPATALAVAALTLTGTAIARTNPTRLRCQWRFRLLESR